MADATPTWIAAVQLIAIVVTLGALLFLAVYAVQIQRKSDQEHREHEERRRRRG